MQRGKLDANLGSLTVRTPNSTRVSNRSASTGKGRFKSRSKRPSSRSLCRKTFFLSPTDLVPDIDNTVPLFNCTLI